MLANRDYQRQTGTNVKIIETTNQPAGADGVNNLCLNKGEFYSAAKEFDRWIYAGGKVSEGLKNRRKAEKTLFLT